MSTSLPWSWSDIEETERLCPLYRGREIARVAYKFGQIGQNGNRLESANEKDVSVD